MFIPSVLCSVFPKPDSLLDLLLGMLVLDPTRRITAGAALQHEWFRQVIGLLALRDLSTGRSRCLRLAAFMWGLDVLSAFTNTACIPLHLQEPLPSADSVFAGLAGRQAPAYPQRPVRPC